MSINEVKELESGVKEIFSSMLMMELDLVSSVVGERCDMSSNITSMIGLGGDIRGMLAVHCPAPVAKDITATFLGMEIDELDDDVKDAIGEIANMVAGNLKVSFAGVGQNIELAIPTSVIGDAFTVRGMQDAKRTTVCLQAPAGQFWLELTYLPSS